MAFVLSTDTVVSAPFNNAVSVNTNVNAQRQDLYQLSNTNPVFDTIVQYKTTVSVTIYAPGPEYSVVQSVNCEPASPFKLSVTPGLCGTSAPNFKIDDYFYATGYSYKKDINSYGQETWSLTTTPKFFEDDLQNELYTTIFLRGVATGTSTSPEARTGVTFTGNTVSSKSMSVSAGFPGVGNAFNLKYGRVTKIGKSTGPGATDGQANVTIPYVTLATDGNINPRKLR